ncbi:MAG: glycosyltransferase family 25 protein [Phaeovulum sp.]|uniref:glycosyltransferase family 25 protein n=1 Tax=Phaeovulum sp. TaxID=2934796 RepID=UPI00272F4A8B|nr:glycosyltransferase family 25 protein [Phaeovulum sp.]MDP2063903.1 glycosyltransferase family 25 protein [Phaeovulum sp.]
MIRSYIIHLPCSTGRHALVAALREQLPLAEIVDAVDGCALSGPERAHAYVGSRYRPPYPFALTAGEIGAFLSHRRCWQNIASGDADFGLVAEDDVALDTLQFGRALTLALRHATPESLVRFPLQDREVPYRILTTDGAIRLFQPRVVGLSTALQIVGRNLAARLLELTAPFDRPVDTLLQMRWVTGANVLSVFPNGARSAADAAGGSTIQTKLPVRQQFYRSWARTRYRARVMRLAKADQPQES